MGVQRAFTTLAQFGGMSPEPLYIGKKANFEVLETVAPEGYILGAGETRYMATLTYDRRFAALKKLSTGAMVDMDSGVELPEGTVPETDNNASLTIPNQRIPEAPKTGDALPVAAVATLGVASGVCLLTLRRRRRKK